MRHGMAKKYKENPIVQWIFCFGCIGAGVFLIYLADNLSEGYAAYVIFFVMIVLLLTSMLVISFREVKESFQKHTWKGFGKGIVYIFLDGLFIVMFLVFFRLHIQDIPYLLNPEEVVLHEVYLDMELSSDASEYYLKGKDEQHVDREFHINRHRFYKDKENIKEYTSVLVKYLPGSKHIITITYEP